jgi:membrane-bound lytic murein transglycosylase MltF
MKKLQDSKPFARSASTSLWLALLLALVLVLLASCDTEAENTETRIAESYTPPRIPDKALESRLLLLKYTISRFGDDSFVSVFAAQIHQESAWCRYMLSRAGAKGCAQFMDRTAQWAIDDPNGLPCKTLDDFLDIPCALSSLVWLNRFNYVRSPQKTLCDATGFMLSKYNGGGVKADQRAAEAAGFDPELWFNHVEKFNGRNRTPGNFKENREYPRKILFVHQIKYIQNDYGGINVCADVQSNIG